MNEEYHQLVEKKQNSSKRVRIDYLIKEKGNDFNQKNQTTQKRTKIITQPLRRVLTLQNITLFIRTKIKPQNPHRARAKERERKEYYIMDRISRGKKRNERDSLNTSLQKFNTTILIDSL